MGISEQYGMILSVLELFLPPQSSPNHLLIQHGLIVLCMPWRYGSKQDIRCYTVAASTDLAWGGGREAGGLAEELTLKLIPDCVISRSREQDDVRVTGEATSGWAGRVC